MRKQLLIAALVLSTNLGKAHSFYTWECCSDQDCWPMGDDKDAREPEPRLQNGYWVLSDGQRVRVQDARPSPDGRFHVCRRYGQANGSVIRPEGKPVCLYTPQGLF